MHSRFEAVVIGVSAGGLFALNEIISKLPKQFIPVIIVMHVKANSDNFIISCLAQHSNLTIKEARSLDSIQSGVIYIAPPGYHLLIEHDKTFSLSVESPIKFSRPSIDVLFESAALAYHEHLIGVVLTGANDDGSQGLKEIKERGGIIIVQDPETAYAREMPRAAIARNTVDYITPLDCIATLLIELAYSEKKEEEHIDESSD